MSLINNRRRAIVPTVDGLTLGAEELRWNVVFSSNINASGIVRGTKFVGDGSELTNLRIPYSFSNMEEDLIPGRNNERDLGKITKRWRNIYTSNIQANGTVSAARYFGDGNALRLDNVMNDILPFASGVNLGSPSRVFDSVYVNNVKAQTVTSTEFIGDGSKLTGITLENTNIYSAVPMDIIPKFHLCNDIGRSDKRFYNVYCGNLSALGVVSGSKLIISSEGMTLNAGGGDGSGGLTGDGTNFIIDIPEDIQDKFNGHVDVSAQSIVGNVIYGKEFIGDGHLIYNVNTMGPIRSNLEPYRPSTIDIGSNGNPFRDLYVDYGYINQDLTIKGDLVVLGSTSLLQQMDFLGDVAFGGNLSCGKGMTVEYGALIKGTVTACNFVGDGRYIDNITHFGMIRSNIEPYSPSTVNIGSAVNPFANIYGDYVNAPVAIKTRTVMADMIGIGLSSLPEAALDVNGTANFRGGLYMNGLPTSMTVMGYILIDQMQFIGMQKIKVARHTLDGFMSYVDEANIGKFIAKRGGLYNITAYAWKSNRGPNDMFLTWRIFHHTFFNNSTVEYRMRGADSRNVFMMEHDYLYFMVESGIEPGSTKGGVLNLRNGTIHVALLCENPDYLIDANS